VFEVDADVPLGVGEAELREASRAYGHAAFSRVLEDDHARVRLHLGDV
jgi:hypothetical protein